MDETPESKKGRAAGCGTATRAGPTRWRSARPNGQNSRNDRTRTHQQFRPLIGKESLAPPALSGYP